MANKGKNDGAKGAVALVCIASFLTLGIFAIHPGSSVTAAHAFLPVVFLLGMVFGDS